LKLGSQTVKLKGQDFFSDNPPHPSGKAGRPATFSLGNSGRMRGPRSAARPGAIPHCQPPPEASFPPSTVCLLHTVYHTSNQQPDFSSRPPLLWAPPGPPAEHLVKHAAIVAPTLFKARPRRRPREGGGQIGRRVIVRRTQITAHIGFIVYPVSFVFHEIKLT